MTKIINEKQPSDLVKAFTTATFGVVAALLVSSFVTQAFAVDMLALLVPDRNRTEASFIAVRTVTIAYPAGSSFANEFDGVSERVTFTVNGTAQNPGNAGDAVAAVNKALAEAKSPVQASAVDLAYTATIRGTDTRTVISYKIELAPTLEQFVLQRGEGGQSGHIVDLEWRGITVDEPVVVNTPEYGEFDVNRPLTLLQKTHPDIAQALDGTQASTIMDQHLLNFEDFDTSITVWHKLFDPVGTYGGGVGLQGTEGAKALTVYSFGEGSIREGSHSVTEQDATVTVDGAQIQIHSQDPPPSGQLTIAGYADEQENQGAEFAIVTIDAPEGVQTATGGFPIQVLLVFGGMMGAIAIFILIKARK
jgi:hypothetical protein